MSGASLVTGGAGFLGAALCRELVRSGHPVRAFDDMSRGDARRLDGQDVTLIRGDVRDAGALAAAARGCATIWHLAAINGTRSFYEEPDRVLDVGVRGALHAVDAAIAAGARRFVFVSSSEVYATPLRVPTPEDERLAVPDVTNPRFSYGGSKIAGELIALHLAARRGLEVVVVRPHNVYGPDMGDEHVVPQLIERILRLARDTDGVIGLPIEGDGSQSRAFCYVDDAARGLRIAGERGAPGSLHHLGVDVETTVGELAEIIARAAGVRVRLVPGPLPEGGTPRRCPSVERLAALGFRAEIPLEEGVARTLAWHVARKRGTGSAMPAVQCDGEGS